MKTVSVFYRQKKPFNRVKALRHNSKKYSAEDKNVEVTRAEGYSSAKNKNNVNAAHLSRSSKFIKSNKITYKHSGLRTKIIAMRTSYVYFS